LITTVIAIIFMWANLIYWFRLFENTTLYIRLIAQTIDDMKQFLLIFVLVTAMFGNAIYAMNVNRRAVEAGVALFEDRFENLGFLSAFLNQYLVALGDFDFENYSSEYANNAWIVWILFVFATMFSQIIILNMLIAIMGDTLDKVFENKQQAILKLKVEVLRDFSIFIEKGSGNKMLFIAEPFTEEEVPQEQWEGKINAIRKMIESQQEKHDHFEGKLMKKLNELKNETGYQLQRSNTLINIR